jgi:hypothetical protein
MSKAVLLIGNGAKRIEGREPLNESDCCSVVECIIDFDGEDLGEVITVRFGGKIILYKRIEDKNDIENA